MTKFTILSLSLAFSVYVSLSASASVSVSVAVAAYNRVGPGLRWVACSSQLSS